MFTLAMPSQHETSTAILLVNVGQWHNYRPIGDNFRIFVTIFCQILNPDLLPPYQIFFIIFQTTSTQKLSLNQHLQDFSANHMDYGASS